MQSSILEKILLAGSGEKGFERKFTTGNRIKMPCSGLRV